MDHMVKKFYFPVLRMFSENETDPAKGWNASVKELGEFLPGLSKSGSGDDVSVSAIIDADSFKADHPLQAALQKAKTEAAERRVREQKEREEAARIAAEEEKKRQQEKEAKEKAAQAAAAAKAAAAAAAQPVKPVPTVQPVRPPMPQQPQVQRPIPQQQPSVQRPMPPRPSQPAPEQAGGTPESRQRKIDTITALIDLQNSLNDVEAIKQRNAQNGLENDILAGEAKKPPPPKP